MNAKNRVLPHITDDAEYAFLYAKHVLKNDV